MERPEPARARRPRKLAPVLRAHPRGDWVARSADELPSVPSRPLAVDAQRLHRRLRDDQTRPGARGRRVAVSRDQRGDRHRGLVPPGAHLRPGRRPAGRRRARHRVRGGMRTATRRHLPIPGHDRHHRRRAPVGVSAIRARANRGRCSSAATPARSNSNIPNEMPCSSCPTTPGLWSQSRSAICPAPGPSCPKQAAGSSAQELTSSCPSPPSPRLDPPRRDKICQPWVRCPSRERGCEPGLVKIFTSCEDRSRPLRMGPAG